MIDLTKMSFPGVCFGEKHTFADFGLLMIGGPEIGAPEVQSKSIQVPGRDGLLHYTTALDGKVHYYDRDWKCTFAVLDRTNFDCVCSNVLNYLHGCHLDCCSDTDPDYYYTGDFSVEDIDYSDGTITIKGSVAPYKTHQVNGSKSL